MNRVRLSVFVNATTPILLKAVAKGLPCHDWPSWLPKSKLKPQSWGRI